MTIAAAVLLAASPFAPETWFHVIGGNASREGLAADIEAIADAGIGGIQFFHGGWAGDKPWPTAGEQIPCLSPKWEELVRFAADECRRRGLTFKMQNCPGWSMSGGPWVTPREAMRKLVAFEPGKMPAFDEDDDYREIGEVEFPLEDAPYMSLTFPNPQQICHAWAYEPAATLGFSCGGELIFSAACPAGAWQDSAGMTFRVPAKDVSQGKKEFFAESPHHYPRKELAGSWSAEPRLDMWEAKAGWGLRRFGMSRDSAPVKTRGVRRLVFGHVNAKRRNHPAPPEATGWECDKMDPRGFEAVWNGYLGRLVKNGVKIDGTLVDSWECGVQSWTWRMEEEFARRAGYRLRPWLPALFGHVLESAAATERFLLDWRNVCSQLIEENYYGAIARKAREHGLSVQFETAFGDVIAGDILRYWKHADEPMCEFWSPHENDGFVGSHDFKPVLPCVSAAHVYGKRRVSAEALTSFELTFDENFRDWKRIVDLHLARGVTHIVFHTFTHNPAVGGKPPSSSFGGGIGSPFLRLQTWWPYLKHFTAYLERCGRELERGVPGVDILMYLGDDLNHKPSESRLLFGNRYKYDYLNADALTTRLDIRDGRFVFPCGMSCRVLWVPKGTFLLDSTRARLAELEAKGGRVVYGDFAPDWPSPPEEALGVAAGDLAGWYLRRDGKTDVFFVAEKDGSSRFVRIEGAKRTVFDPVAGTELSEAEWAAARRGAAGCERATAVALEPARDYPPWETKRVYAGRVAVPRGTKRMVLDLGEVRDWATVYVNGRKAAELWCRPYACDIAPFAGAGGEAEIRVETVSTWYNALVRDASLPEGERRTWTIKGPKAGSEYHPAGLIGPVRLEEYPATADKGNVK